MGDNSRNSQHNTKFLPRQGKTEARTFSLYEKNFELIREISEFYNCNMSEAVRTAVRSYVYVLRDLQR